MTRFAQGQLIVADYLGRDVLWTVIKTDVKKATLLAHLGSYIAEVTTRTLDVPDDWQVFDNADAAAALKLFAREVTDIA